MKSKAEAGALQCGVSSWERTRKFLNQWDREPGVPAKANEREAGGPLGKGPGDALLRRGRVPCWERVMTGRAWSLGCRWGGTRRGQG